MPSSKSHPSRERGLPKASFMHDLNASPSPSIPTRQTELPELPFLIHPRRTRTELALILLVRSTFHSFCFRSAPLESSFQASFIPSSRENLVGRVVYNPLLVTWRFPSVAIGTSMARLTFHRHRKDRIVNRRKRVRLPHPLKKLWLYLELTRLQRSACLDSRSSISI